MLGVLTCIALVAWTVFPTAAHVPDIIETLQEHAERIAEHGHSHGLQEDLAWAMHGHSHDMADHDHGHALLSFSRSGQTLDRTSTGWRGHTVADWSPPLFRLERPPRA